MRNFLYLLRHIFLVIFAFIFILLFPLARTYKVSHSKLFTEDFWVSVVGSADFSKIVLSQIPEKEKEEIEKSPKFEEYRKQINDYFNEYIIERKFRPFMKKIVDYLLKKRESLPKPVSLRSERSKLYLFINKLFSTKFSKLPYKYRQQAEIILQRKVFKHFPNTLVAKRIIIPKVLRNIDRVRERLAVYNNYAKWALYAPILLVILIVLLAFTPRKILGWLGTCLISSIPLFLAYNLILFYGLAPAEYLYDQLRIVPDLRAFFNETIITLKYLKSTMRDILLKPIAIEAIIYLIIGIGFVVFAFILKKKKQKTDKNEVEVVE